MKLLKCMIFALWIGLAAGWASAQTNLHVGAMSDYIWRGINSNDDKPGIILAADHDMVNGIYFGAWATNLSNLEKDTSFEIDAWLGWQRESESGFKYGLGYIYYAYTSKYLEVEGAEPESLEFGEFNATLGYRWLDVVYSYDPENEDRYIEVSLILDLTQNLYLTFHGGDYDFKDADGADATDWEVSLTRSWDHLEIKGAYSRIDYSGDPDPGSDDTAYLVVTWNWTIE